MSKNGIFIIRYKHLRMVEILDKFIPHFPTTNHSNFVPIKLLFFNHLLRAFFSFMVIIVTIIGYRFLGLFSKQR